MLGRVPYDSCPFVTSVTVVVTGVVVVVTVVVVVLVMAAGGAVGIGTGIGTPIGTPVDTTGTGTWFCTSPAVSAVFQRCAVFFSSSSFTCFSCALNSISLCFCISG